MWHKTLLWVERYEKHLSALAMIAGFVADNLLFIRVDLLQTQILLAGYALACFIAIPLLQWLEMRAQPQSRRSGLRLVLPFVTQFALGGFWSAFVIFYGRSADFGASWPFLLFLFLVLLGSEYFHRYHARLVFTSILFFFALYSCAIFEVPIFTGTLGTGTFLISGLIAIFVFGLFTMLLRAFVRQRFLEDVWRIRAGALVVLILMNVFYFTNILPPLPLSAEAAGIYHLVSRVPGAYQAMTESNQSWEVRYFGFPPTLHVTLGDSLYAYSSIFAPTALTTDVVHEWQWYDPEQKAWMTRSRISYSIVGGRDGGYRGYSAVPIINVGKWRVNVETSDGRLIVSLPFTAVQQSAPPKEELITLK